jgi:hypothetical protein
MKGAINKDTNNILMPTSHSLVGWTKSFLKDTFVYSYDPLFVYTQLRFFAKFFHQVVFPYLSKSSVL